MAILKIVLDSRPGYLRGGSAAHSLLLAPAGNGNILSEMLSQVASLTGEPPVILPNFEPVSEYSDAIHAGAGCEVRVISQGQLEEIIYGHEPSDVLLLINPACFPTDSAEFVKELKTPLFAGSARHLVSMASDSGGSREFVHLDADGRVRRIQRYYDGVTWVNTSGIFCSMVSVASLRAADCRLLTCLSELRRDLARRQILASDVCLHGPAIDLTKAGGLLHLAEREVREIVWAARRSSSETKSGLVAGEGCEIHPTARIHGHVVLQHHVKVMAGATIIGPALIGHDSVVAADASVAQCLVMPHTRVRTGARRSCQVLHADQPAGEAARESIPARLAMGTTGKALSRPSAYSAVKAVVDSVVAFLGLIALAPLLAIVAVIIRLESRGSVFFGHVREGKNGKSFRCWKFRTMSADAHAQQRLLYAKNAVDGPQFKLENDPRITRVGRWLRTSNIDELPQLFNVLIGQMSLIGPRPSPFRENQICVPWREARLSVRPGITGLWQLCRHERDAGDFHQWIYFDMLYVKHMSFWLDLKILIGTLLTMGGRWSLPVARVLPGHNAALSQTWPVSTNVVPFVGGPGECADDSEAEYQVV